MKALHINIYKGIRTAACLAACLATAFTTSCSDMMEPDSDRVLWADDNRLDNVNDSLYSAIGILAQVQRIADRTVLFGELRGDLMTTSASAHSDLKDIENLDIKADNSFADRSDFYQIINNCNFALLRMDTTLVVQQEKALLPEYVAIKALRDWVYVQMGLIYGKAKYSTQPILSVEDTRRELPELSLDELMDKAIEDLTPHLGVRPLDYGSLDGHSTAQCFIPLQMFLGDLYLYKNDYENAARSYFSLIDKNHYLVTREGANYWMNSQRLAMYAGYNGTYQNDVLFKIPFSSSLRALHSQMAAYTYSETEQPWLLPSAAFVSEMEDRAYLNTDNNLAVTQVMRGDLRGYGRGADGTYYNAAFGPVMQAGSAVSEMMITKFFNNLSGTEYDKIESRRLLSLPVYRTELLYLRFAEAINRLGKPSIAFAVLKYGLNSATLSEATDPTLQRINPEEYAGESYLAGFLTAYYNNNEGIAVHGRGTGLRFDKETFVIPALPTREDSVLYVEDCIADELAAENCFEGNRFFDLLTLSRHRANHPVYMAERVSRKFVGREETMRQKLLTLDNWFVRE